jgi:hypothetical protein
MDVTVDLYVFTKLIYGIVWRVVSGLNVFRLCFVSSVIKSGDICDLA